MILYQFYRAVRRCKGISSILKDVTARARVREIEWKWDHSSGWRGVSSIPHMLQNQKITFYPSSVVPVEQYSTGPNHSGNNDDDDKINPFTPDLAFNSIEKPRQLCGPQLILAGTGGGSVSKRGHSCTALRLPERTFLFDAGEGAQFSLRQTPVPLRRITDIFITHLHGDHINGLVGVILTRSNQGGNDLTIHGPPTVAKFINTILYLSFSHLNHNLFFREFAVPGVENSSSRSCEVISPIDRDAQRGWELMNDDILSVTAHSIVHKKGVPTVGYIVRLKERPGMLQMDKLREKGLKGGPHCRILKNNLPYQLPDGSVIQPSDVMTSPFPGSKIVYLGDTCDPSGIAEEAMNCDVLVHEMTLCEDQRSHAVKKGHSTPSMAFKFAEQIKAKALVLNHVGPRWLDDKYLSAGIQQSQEGVYSGQVYVSYDGMGLDLPFKRRPGRERKQFVSLVDGRGTSSR